jgi:low affinity Fe/Cu permease
MMRRNKSLAERTETFSGVVSRWTGSTSAFIAALAIIVVWGVVGPLFHFSDTWQLVINTSTTVVTFLMVFLIQRAQNKDALAIHLKLNELVAAVRGASNRLIDVEALAEEDLRILEHHYGELAKLASRDMDVSVSHSIEEARVRHIGKQKGG